MGYESIWMWLQEKRPSKQESDTRLVVYSRSENNQVANWKKYGVVSRGSGVDGSLKYSELILVRKIHIKETPDFFTGLRDYVDQRKCPGHTMENTWEILRSLPYPPLWLYKSHGILRPRMGRGHN